MALPIEGIVPQLVSGLSHHRNFVLQAEPGAGKTTRVPVVLLEAGLADRGEIWVSQPRRIAARMAASRVASLLGEPLGERCGYQVRFDNKTSTQTRIRFVTEGILARRLRDDPELRGVSTVVLDEFHERHIDTDVGLALLKHLQTRRDDLRVGVMSATMAAEPIAAYLGCPPLSCPGRTFPIAIEHLPRASDKPLATQVAQALRRLEEIEGHVLVFLPGAAEIRASAAAAQAPAKAMGRRIVTLHGDLPANEQDDAVRSDAPRIILATNIAEASVTIDGVAAVIDSGLVRRPSHNPWSGMPTLTLAKTSQASAIQRAGRAGRTRAGVCLRLFTEHDFERRAAFDEPELARLDLAAAMLDLQAAGIDDPHALPWFEAPPQASLEAAQTLLHRLGAIDASGRLTPLGRSMLELPVHPRLAKLILEGRELGVHRWATGAAALLSERPIRNTSDRARPPERVGYADAWEDLMRLEGNDRRGLDPVACKQVQRVWSQLRRPAGPSDSDDPERGLCRAMLRAFPDRLAQRRESDGALVFAEGGSAVLDPSSAVQQSRFLVAVAAQERKSGTKGPRTVVRGAAHVELEWILDDLIDAIEEDVVGHFDPTSERVETTEELRLGALVLEQRRLQTDHPATTAALREAARSKGVAAFLPDADALEQLKHRARFANRFDERVPAIDDDLALQCLLELCEGRKSFAELRKVDLLSSLVQRLPPDGYAALERLAPRQIQLAGARRLKVHYEPDRDPWVESRLQDFFGSSEGPSLASGRVPVVLHLLAPNRRAVQVTTDLSGFWDRHYPELRKTLMRRYPKHAWPEDPRTAEPPSPRRRKR